MRECRLLAELAESIAITLKCKNDVFSANLEFAIIELEQLN